ncbi:MAG: hypothetical protein ABJE66_30460 [Deltaproteobacteria bacterium]
MSSRVPYAPLTAELERFQEQVRGLAMAMVRGIVREEFRRRIDQIKASLDAPAPSQRRTRRKGPRLPTAEPARVDLETASTPQLPVTSDPKRRWTRDSIIEELASWLASGTTIDASFVKRHGPRGLVAASKREFGRFDAALNVASLRVASLYPDKPATPAQH